jgi:hypothetical protein
MGTLALILEVILGLVSIPFKLFNILLHLRGTDPMFASINNLPFRIVFCPQHIP